jgi:hypothetical protein
MDFHYVINRPASETNPNAVNIGPTAVDFSMLPGILVPESEAKLMKRWAAQDLSRFYAEQRSNRYSA